MSLAIVCVGNRQIAADDLGPRVYDRLRDVERAGGLPEGIALIDGGLRGLDLLPTIERARHVIFVDALAPADGVLDRPARGITVSREAPPLDEVARWDHAAGLGYLLQVLPQVCDGPPPPWELVGAAGIADDAIVALAAEQVLALAAEHARARRGARTS